VDAAHDEPRRAEQKIDYLRCFQKPGWLGAVSGAWTNAANWGADGIPGAGYAAVFNMNAAQSIVTLPTNQPVQSLSFDNANLSAMTISGPGALLLGAGTNSVLCAVFPWAASPPRRRR